MPIMSLIASNRQGGRKSGGDDMPRESPSYREILRLLNEKFNYRMLLTVPEVMEVTGYGRNSVYKYYPVEHGRVNIVDLAQAMSRSKK